MYEDLQHVARTMQAVTRYDPLSMARDLAAIDQALTTCAEKTDTALRSTVDETQRAHLRTVYRGLLASRRAAARLADTVTSSA